MDDLWEPVELTKVEVPAHDSRNKFKIVFTTRSEEVCGHMDAQKKIKVGCLTWDKAWNLFQEKVGKETLLLHPDIPKLAEIVANECGGLPLALITVGRVMACKKTPQEWKHAVQVLRRFASEFSGMGDKIFILKDDLVYFWMCEDILDEYGNVEEAKNESYHIIGTLLTSCLLEDEGDSVKMHDVIRDMALWLACDLGKEGENILVDTGAPNVAKWKNAKRVSLMSSGITSLDETPRSPNLLTLFLRGSSLKRIVDDFFDFMPTLRVLDLSENFLITQLPTGVCKSSFITTSEFVQYSHKMVVGGVSSMCTPKKILIAGFPMLTRLPLNSSSAQTSNLIIEGEEKWWNGLEWENQAARNVFFPASDL
ncbi:unnamed protein product [Prunus armeniaca]|uniref:NB-ARC domain-containing protein n=1 Tax=Prunus armeniaca TaxID=36596 RepID=A0A6J5U946_PRUAR|nr:unnamed protein product [Prunus armeniaca]